MKQSGRTELVWERNESEWGYKQTAEYNEIKFTIFRFSDGEYRLWCKDHKNLIREMRFSHPNEEKSLWAAKDLAQKWIEELDET